MTRLAICGAVATFVAVSLAMPAQAVRRYNVTGSPGAALMPPVRGWWFYTESAVVRFMPRSVARSPLFRTSSQRICVDYRVYSFTPGPAVWRFDWHRRYCTSVQPGYRSNWTYLDYAARVPLKAYNVEVWVTWAVGSRRIASARWDYDNVRDYGCQTVNCYTDYGYGNVAYIMFDV